MKNGVEMTNRIPSPEDFERANRESREEFRNLDQVEKNVSQHFRGTCPLHHFAILPQSVPEFRAYVFFETDKYLRLSNTNGIQPDIINFVYDELEKAGRGKRGEIKVAFEFDSYENVVENYKGNYYLRLL